MKRIYTIMRRRLIVSWGRLMRYKNIHFLERSYILEATELPPLHGLRRQDYKTARLLRLGYPILLRLWSEQTEFGFRYVQGYYWFMLQARRGDQPPRLRYFETTFHVFLSASHEVPCTF